VSTIASFLSALFSVELLENQFVLRVITARRERSRVTD